MTWRRIAAFRLVTRMPEVLLAFYVALGFAAGDGAPITPGDMRLLGLAGGGTRWPLGLGPSRLDLDCYEVEGRPYPADADAASLCFQHLALVTSDPAEAWGRARAAGARPISRNGEPVTLPKRAGGVTAIKVRDPAGHPLELIAFPDADARGWPGRGLLGIDHSALSVSNTAASLDFYGRQGLSVSTTSLNHGPEQARLDSLDEPQVDVAALQPPGHGPSHLELLGYRHPAGAACGPVAVADVAATRIVWEADTPGLVHDPDGHRHEIVGC